MTNVRVWIEGFEIPSKAFQINSETCGCIIVYEKLPLFLQRLLATKRQQAIEHGEEYHALVYASFERQYPDNFYCFSAKRDVIE